jgi:hypothetical protein
LENLGKKLHYQDFAKKAAFFEAAFFGKSWPNLGKRKKESFFE